MSPTLGRGQSVTQAVVVPQDEFDPNKAPMVVSLFKPDGTPFLADTATVYTVMAVLWNPLTPEAAEALLRSPSSSPYPFKTLVLNQEDESLNGIWQGMAGAPGTSGDQNMQKMADLPTNEAVVVGQWIMASPSRNLVETLDTEDLVAADGGVVLVSALGPGSGDGPTYEWSIAFDGPMIKSRLDALES